MRKSALVLSALIGIAVAGPAFADCQREVDRMSNSGVRMRGEAGDQLLAAKQSLSQRDEAGCMAHVRNAQDAMDSRGRSSDRYSDRDRYNDRDRYSDRDSRYSDSEQRRIDEERARDRDRSSGSSGGSVIDQLLNGGRGR